MKSVWRNFACGLVAALVSFSPVRVSAATLVELFTSQGCSSCPSADLYMKDLSKRGDVIPLAFHVDYWDYLGWKDAMAKPEFSERQIVYQQSRQEKQIYTPQIIVGGRHSFSGSDNNAIENSFKLFPKVEPVAMQALKNGASFEITFTNTTAKSETYQIMVAHVLPPQTVEITSGENKGKLIEYTNVVSHLEKLADWNSAGPKSIVVKAIEGLSAVIFVQKDNLGEVVFAQKLNK